MTFWTLFVRSLRFHARAHVGVVLGAAIGSAALIGALMVGDSVRGTLRQRALARLGGIQSALVAPDRLFQASLSDRLRREPGTARPASTSDKPRSPQSSELASAVLTLPAIVARQDGSRRANRVNVIGVDAASWGRLAHWGSRSAQDDRADSGKGARPNGAAGLDADFLAGPWKTGQSALLNETLARQLAATPGDDLIVRVRKPSALGLDSAISPRSEGASALRLKVGGILPPGELGDFSLSAQPVPPANLFIPIESLQRAAGAEGRANLIVFTASTGQEEVASALRQVWLPEDAALSVRVIQFNGAGKPADPTVEVTSARVFLEPAVVKAALGSPSRDVRGATNHAALDASFTNGIGLITYLANLIQLRDRGTPYSMVTAAPAPFTPPGMRDDEILLNEWLADDLSAKPGDQVALSFYIPDSGSRLLERTNSFRVRGIVPLDGIYSDRTLMPAFPGLAKAESTKDWDAGFPLVYPIREKDEAYWRKFRGTPKAFITIGAGQALWSNRFGALTAIRYAVPPNMSPEDYRGLVYGHLRDGLDPGDLGVRVEQVRQQALQAAAQAQDFGQLFLGFSLFLVVSALLLMSLMFQFGLEQRAAEVGTFLALGFTPKQVRRMLLAEGAGLALIGGVLGALGGFGYARGMLWGLATLWRDAVGPGSIDFQATPGSLVIGTCASTVVAVLTLWLTLRRQARQPVRELLAGHVRSADRSKRSRGVWVALASGLPAVAVVGWALLQGQKANAGVFFGAGVLVLVAGLGLVAAWLGRLSLPRERSDASFSMVELAVRGCARRPRRALATVALLSCGCFVVVAIGVFRIDATLDAHARTSGTGGFALLGESTLPVVQDLNTDAGRDFFGLSPADLAGVKIVPFRVREGDEASCLNLNRPQKPRLLGVSPAALAGRFAFTESAAGLRRDLGWQLLRPSSTSIDAGTSSTAPVQNAAAADAVPAIADANSIEWALGKRLGDTLDYKDEQGREFKVRLVAAVANSILQGSLIIDEAEFVKRFPSESGYRLFLVDAPSNSVARVNSSLSRALQDVGLELTSATDRMRAFDAVENTYLGTFQVLGGLGLLLGSAGLGLVVLRNILERRSELALLLAVGFRRRSLRGLVLGEHGMLLALGLGLGALAAATAVLPTVFSPGTHLPVRSLALTLVAVGLNGLLWTWGATQYALRGNLLTALREE